MEELKFRVDQRRAGKRLDKFLVDIVQKKYSRTFIKKLIDDNKVFVNEKAETPHYKVLEGDLIKLSIPDPVPLDLMAEEIPLNVVYEDGDLLVVNKESGISVHPVGNNLKGTLCNALLSHCKDLSGIGGVYRPGIVHRLDKETSGLLVVAKNDISHTKLSDQFKERSVKRKYIALVKGVVQLDNARIDLPIARRKKDITKMGVSFTDEKKKHAITNYTVLKRFKNFTMLEVTLETGRTHQIRVHLSHSGYPVLGDKLYGSSKGLGRVALHAKTLGFTHPTKNKFMEFDSELPSDMKELITRGKL